MIENSIFETENKNGNKFAIVKDNDGTYIFLIERDENTGLMIPGITGEQIKSMIQSCSIIL